MKIAVSATGPSLEAEVEPRFGRCQGFVIVDSETMEFEALDNSNAQAMGGAGIATAQMMAGKGVEVVLTGNCGPNAYQTLAAAGIQVITGASGSIRNAVEAYKSGGVQASSQPNVASHYGTGGGMGQGMGQGMGMGRGGGMGMGRGVGMGRGMGMAPMASLGPQAANVEGEVQELKAQNQILLQQLNEMQRRMEKLEKEK